MTSTERVRRWRKANPDRYREARRRELGRDKLRREAVRDYIDSTVTKEATSK